MGTTLLVQEVDKVHFRTTALVVNTILVVLGEEFDCRETAHSIPFGEVGILLVIGVNVSNDTLWKS